MQVHYSMDALSDMAYPVVTVGSFDGVHKDHRVILGRLNKLVKLAHGSSFLSRFHRHSRMVLYPASSGQVLKLLFSLEAIPGQGEPKLPSLPGAIGELIY